MTQKLKKNCAMKNCSQLLTTKKKTDTSDIINNPDEYVDGAAAINTPARCLAKTTRMITPKSLSKKTVHTTIPNSPSKATEIQIGTFVSNNFQKEVLHTLTFIKHELRCDNEIELGRRLDIFETRSDSNVHNDNSS